MHIRHLIIASLLLYLFASAQGQQEQRFVLLPAHEAKSVASLYPKDGPLRIDGSWQPSNADLSSLEENLQQVSQLTSDNGWPSSVRIDHPDQYFRQYIAVLQNGKKRIFINALCDVQSMPHWRDHLIIVSDGATCFWHALYDPATGKVFQLEINGRA